MPSLAQPIRPLTRSVRTPWLVLAGLVLLTLASTRVWPTRSDRPGVSKDARGRSLVTKKRTIHYVTPRQVVEANAMVRNAVTDMAATAQDGIRRDWAALSGGQPVVLVFVKEGCPCNVEFEPLFQRAERLYRGKVRFAAVIDADVEFAKFYATELKTPYPVLADPGKELIRRFQAKNGGYVVLLTSDATIDGVWPGCSAEGLRDLGRRIARLVGVEERVLDTSGMSRPLITSCPFAS